MEFFLQLKGGKANQPSPNHAFLPLTSLSDTFCYRNNFSFYYIF
jgi:hypothetical protein